MTRRPARSGATAPAVAEVAAVAAEVAVDADSAPDPGADPLAAAVARLSLARDQLGEVIALLEEGSSCQDVVARLALVSRAVDRAGFAVISTGLRECILSPGQGATDTAAMEKLFLSLA